MATEQQMANLAKAREKRRANIAARRAAPTPSLPVKADDQMLGITNEDCCICCTQERCVISGKAYCGHPKKCGLQPADKANPQTMERYNKARKVLAHAEIDRRP